MPTVSGIVTDSSGNEAAWSASWDVATPESTWEAMRDEVLASRSLAAADAWYAAHTGIGSVDIATDLPAGYEDPGPLAEDDLVNGSLDSTHDGQVFIGVRGPRIRMNHNNVTYLRCWVTGATGTYGAAYNPAGGTTLGGARLESCTLAYPLLDGQAGYDPKDPGYFAQAARPGGIPYSSIVRRCDISGWAGGVQGRNALLEYNWHHDLQYPSGYHANQARLQGSSASGRIWRCYGTGGSSGVFSLYFDKEPTNNIAYEENFLNGEIYNGSPRPNYLTNMKNGAYVTPAVGIVVRNNYYGPIRSSAALTTEAVRWGEDGNILGPNFDVARGITF